MLYQPTAHRREVPEKLKEGGSLKHFISVSCFIFIFSSLAWARPQPPNFGPAPVREAQEPQVGTPFELTFGTAARTIVTGVCSKNVNVRTSDSTGKIVKVTQPTTISLLGAPATFYSDAACENQVISMIIPAGGYRIVFYFTSLETGKIPITASSPGLKPATQTETATASTTHSVELTWNASTSPDIVAYDVYRGVQNGGPYTKIATTSSSQLDYTDTQVTNGDTYYYVVTASDSQNEESAYSNQAEAIIP